MPITTARRALNNDPHCGDASAHWRVGNQILLCLVDGLGHGEFAEQAADAAINYIAFHRRKPLPDIIAGCNEAIRNTRGVAMGLVSINEKTGELTHAGIGNIRALVVNQETAYLGSDFGIVGGGYRSLSLNTMTLHRGDLVIMTSDGVKEKMDINASKILADGVFETLADKILKRWGHGQDDAAVLVYKFEPKHLGKVG